MTPHRRKVQKLVFLTLASIVVNTIYLMRIVRKDFVVAISSHGKEKEEFLCTSSERISPLEKLQYNFQNTLEGYSTSKSKLDEEIKERIGETSKLAAITRCPSTPFLLILVHSKPSNFLSREAIRLSWGSPHNPINRGSWTKTERSWKTIFVVGQANKTRSNDLIMQESRRYGDVIIGQFSDNFRQLSRKMVFGLRWSMNFCLSKYIMKTDEDCFVNIIPLLSWLNDIHTHLGHEDFYVGKVQSNIQVEREKDNRYFVSKKDYTGKYYKPYISGGGYLFSGHLLTRLVHVSSKIRLLPPEDVSFGLLMRHIGVKPQFDKRFLPFVNCDRSYETLFERPMCHFREPFVVHGVSDKQQIYMHYNVLLMNFVPTICSYIDSQKSPLSRQC